MKFRIVYTALDLDEHSRCGRGEPSLVRDEFVIEAKDAADVRQQMRDACRNILSMTEIKAPDTEKKPECAPTRHIMTDDQYAAAAASHLGMTSGWGDGPPI